MIPVLQSSLLLTRFFTVAILALYIFSLFGGIPKGPFIGSSWASSDNILLALWGSCPRNQNRTSESYYSGVNVTSYDIPCLTIFNGPRFNNPLTLGAFSFGPSLSIFSLHLFGLPLVPAAAIFASYEKFISATVASGCAFAFQLFGLIFAIVHFQSIVVSNPAALAYGQFRLDNGVYIGGAIMLLCLVCTLLYITAFYHSESNIILDSQSSKEPSDLKGKKFSFTNLKSILSKSSSTIEIMTVV